MIELARAPHHVGAMRPLLAALVIALVAAACARGGQHEEVGEFKNDLVGNEIKLEALKDPKVEGVTYHMSYFDRAVWDRLAKRDWFENPSNSSIACRQTGPIIIGDIDLDRNGEEVFSQQQSLIFKQLAVRRIYDASNETLIYVAYSRKPIEGSAKMSISTISLYGEEVEVPSR